MFRRHPILSSAVLLLLLAVTALATLVLTFDLNRYREQLQARLSEVLSQPVRLGASHLSWHHGPAFEFADLRIGPGDGEAGVVKADRVFLKLEPRPLLHGRITLDEILVDAPHLNITLHASGNLPGAAQTPPLLLDQTLLETALIRSLKVQDGTLNLVDLRDPGRPYSVSLEGIEGRVTDLALSRKGRIDLKGTLQQEGRSTPFTLTGEIDPSSDIPRWRETGLALEMKLLKFSPAPLVRRITPGRWAMGVPGRLSLRIGLSGSAASGLDIAADLEGDDLQIRLPELYRTPLEVEHIGFRGTWTAEPESNRFSNLQLQLDGLSLSGQFSLQTRDGETWVDGDLASFGLSLSRLSRFIPDAKSTIASLKKSLRGGTLRLDSARFAGPLARLLSLDEPHPLREAALSLEDGAFRMENGTTLEEVSLSARLKENRLDVTDGKALFLKTPVRFSATLDHPFLPSPAFAMKAEGTFEAAPLLDRVKAEGRERFSAEGTIPLYLAVEGTPDWMVIDLSADLKDLSARVMKQPFKAAGQPGDFFLTAEVTPERFELSHTRLHLPPLELRARGSMERDEERAFDMVLDVPRMDMKKARPLWPLLEKLQTQGEIGLHYELEGKNGTVSGKRGSVALRDFGLHLTRVIADIDGATGQVLLSDSEARAEGLSLNLGDSALKVTGTLKDFTAPRIDLRVRGRAVRASDLVFRSETAILRDLDGHLIIDRNGILFDPVRVRLEGGTDATVRGTVQDFGAPRVNLDVVAERGNIDEVIALWQGPKKRRKAPRKEQEGERKRKGSLRITARAETGTLGNLRFQEAEAEISLLEDLLIIHPLRFKSDQGLCTGQVLVDSRTGSPPLLKISGHLESFDAAAIYQDLLKRRGLVTGTLEGDFYLEGRAGKEFLQSSMGGFDLTVEHGVLRRFTVLSKVFSLLNVSQILTFRLPDMAREGMPFEKLSATAALSKGILSTEDLFIKSRSMNLTLLGDLDLPRNTLDLTLGVKPLRTVDKIVTQIPIAGWLLTGEEKALITAHFRIKGKSEDPEVYPVPITSVSEKVFGIFKRIFELPEKMITDPGEVLTGEGD